MKGMGMLIVLAFGGEDILQVRGWQSALNFKIIVDRRYNLWYLGFRNSRKSTKRMF